MTDYLLDTNILLRAAQPEASTHSVAVEAVASLLERGESVFITAQNLIEFWAVATRPAEANGLGWSPTAAESEIQQLRDQIPMLEDQPPVFSNWLQLVTQHAVLGKQVHDARLVAVMLTHGVTHLLTFNGADFQRYPLIRAVHPSELVSK
jgi:predicted nucleic acid-binding protein